ncbi:MAG: response regulator [Candidatus Pacebacteria bacterium]|nr:response regulator [Candidatus Paceibacterota bacterium]
MKILLIDDDDFLRDMYATKFSERGHTVEVAQDAEKGADLLREKAFDAVLMDMIMPGMTGIELLNVIQSEHIGGDAVCVVLSNQASDEEVTAATAAGADGYIIKAESIPSEVVTKVEDIVSKVTKE